MKIRDVIWYPRFVEKLQEKHGVEIEEVEEALKNRKRVRQLRRGNLKRGRCVSCAGTNRRRTLFGNLFCFKEIERCYYH